MRCVPRRRLPGAAPAGTGARGAPTHPGREPALTKKEERGLLTRSEVLHAAAQEELRGGRLSLPVEEEQRDPGVPARATEGWRLRERDRLARGDDYDGHGRARARLGRPAAGGIVVLDRIFPVPPRGLPPPPGAPPPPPRRRDGEGRDHEVPGRPEQALDTSSEVDWGPEGVPVLVRERDPDERVPARPAEHGLLRDREARPRRDDDRGRGGGRRVRVRALDVVLEDQLPAEAAKGDLAAQGDRRPGGGRAP